MRFLVDFYVNVRTVAWILDRHMGQFCRDKLHSRHAAKWAHGKNRTFFSWPRHTTHKRSFLSRSFSSLSIDGSSILDGVVDKLAAVDIDTDDDSLALCITGSTFVSIGSLDSVDSDTCWVCSISLVSSSLGLFDEIGGVNGWSRIGFRRCSISVQFVRKTRIDSDDFKSDSSFLELKKKQNYFQIFFFRKFNLGRWEFVRFVSCKQVLNLYLFTINKGYAGEEFLLSRNFNFIFNFFLLF